MPMLIFASLLGASLFIFFVSFLFDWRKRWKDDIVKGLTGVKNWRDRLNVVSDSFIALGAEPLLLRAASKTEDPVLKQFGGQTLTLYKQIKDYFVCMSFAYNSSVRAVQQAENVLKSKGAKKLVHIRRATKLAEEGLVIKEISADRYTRLVGLDRSAPKPPSYQIGYLLNVSQRLAAEITSSLKQIADCPARVNNLLAVADKNQAAAVSRYEALRSANVVYLPFEQRLAAIVAARNSITNALPFDPLGSLAYCSELDRLIAALAKELEQAGQQLDAVVLGEQQHEALVKWVASVRSTQVTCPWADNAGEVACWKLATADSNPDSQIAQSQTLLAQARQSLSNGQLAAVAGECKQALAARNQADKMVKALISAKTAVDEQVPRVRAELATIHSELAGVSSGTATNEMAELVERTCRAVDGRINEVHALYLKQLFPEALVLLTGTAGSEYGMPVAKLLAQGKELLQLLKKAAQVASSLSKQ